MECWLSLFFIFTISSHFVASYPHREQEYQKGLYQPTAYTNNRRLSQDPPAFNNVQFVNNRPQNNFPQNQPRFVRPESQQNVPQNYEQQQTQTWVRDQKTPPQNPYPNTAFATKQNVNNGLQAYQQSTNQRTPQTFREQTVPGANINQQQRYYGKTNYGYPQYQNQESAFSNAANRRYESPNYRKEWQAQNTPWQSSVNRYQQPETGYQKTPLREPANREPIPVKNTSDRLQQPGNSPVGEYNIPDSGPQPVTPSGTVVKDDIDKNNTLLQPSEIDYIKPSRKRYVAVHSNGQYSEIDDIDGIEEENFDSEKLKSKDIVAIVEIEEEIKEETENSSKLPDDTDTDDTGINRNPQVNNSNVYNQDSSGKPQNYPVVLRSELRNSEVNDYDNDNDMNYFKSKYIMPIQSTTANSFDSIKLSTTESNGDNYINPSTPQQTENSGIVSTTENLKWVENFDDRDDGNVPVLKPSTQDDEKPFEDKVSPKSHILILPPPSKSEENEMEATLLIKNGVVVIVNNASDSSIDNQNHLVSVTGDNVEGGFSLDSTKSAETSKSDSLSMCGNNQSGKPVVWTKPDNNFWEKVTNGNKDVEVVYILNIKTPALVEKTTKIHYYENGTVVEEFTETVWDRESGEDPKVVKSTRVVSDPDE